MAIPPPSMEEIRIPPEKWYMILDRFTRIDEELESLIKIIGILNNNIVFLISLMGGGTSNPPYEVKMPGTMEISNAPVRKVASRRMEISDQDTYTIDGSTDIIKIYVDSGKVQYDTRSVTSDSDIIPEGSTLIWRVPRGEINKLYLKPVSGTSIIYVSEWQYVITRSQTA